MLCVCFVDNNCLFGILSLAFRINESYLDGSETVKERNKKQNMECYEISGNFYFLSKLNGYDSHFKNKIYEFEGVLFKY